MHLSNAIKFTEVGEILLRAEVLEKNAENIQLRFSVKDTGVGIPSVKTVCSGPSNRLMIQQLDVTAAQAWSCHHKN